MASENPDTKQKDGADRGLGRGAWVIAVLAAGALLAVGGYWLLASRSAQAPVVSQNGEQTAPPPLREAEPATAPAIAPKAVEPPSPPGVQEYPGSIAGRVLRLDGTLAAAVEVRAVAAGAENRAAVAEPALTASGEDGRFALENLPVGTYTLTAWGKSGFASARVPLYSNAPHAEVTLILRPGGPIAGRVLADGKPVTGARLTALIHDGEERQSRPDRLKLVEESGADGAFRFAMLPLKTWQFYVTAAGYAPAQTEAISVGTEDATISLTAGAVLTGQVVDAQSGGPLGGITVTAQRVNYRVEPDKASSEENGKFTLNSLIATDYILNIEDPVLTLASGPLTVTVQPANNPEVQLLATAGGIVRGRLVDAASGAGIAGGRILVLRTDAKGASRTSDPTGDAGAFEIRSLGVGSYQLAPRGAPGTSAVGGNREKVVIQITAGAVVEGVEVPVDRGITISGVVVRADGAPVSGAYVRGDGDAEVFWQDETHSGPDGSFVLAGLEQPSEVTLSAVMGELENADLKPIAVPAEGLYDVRLVLDLPANGLIAGQVVNERGEPLPVRVTGWQDGRNPPAVPPDFYTGPDGMFLLPNLTPGVWKMTVQYRQRRQEELTQVRLGPGQELRGLRLVLPLGDSVTITGRVTDESGKPLRASFAAHEIVGEGPSGPGMMPSEFVYTDAEGHYAIAGLTPGANYVLFVQATGHGSETREDVAAGSEGVDFVLRANVRVSGRVLDARGNPVTAYEISSVQSGRMIWDLPPHPQQVADLNGRFSLDLAPGFYSLSVRAPRFEEQQFRVGLVPETPSEDLELRLK